MADIVDDAQEYNELYQRVALENHRLRTQQDARADFNGKDCVDCGETIISKRIALGFFRCIECQTDREQREKQFSR